jgi:hypothetical protein
METRAFGGGIQRSDSVVAPIEAHDSTHGRSMGVHLCTPSHRRMDMPRIACAHSSEVL